MRYGIVIGLGALLATSSVSAQGAPPADAQIAETTPSDAAREPEAVLLERLSALERRVTQLGSTIEELRAALEQNGTVLESLNEGAAEQAEHRQTLDASAEERARLSRLAIAALERADREILLGRSDEAMAAALLDSRELLFSVANEANAVGSEAEALHASRSLDALARAETALNNRNSAAARELVAFAWMQTHALRTLAQDTQTLQP